ncbi:MAG: hypothetical protein ABI678_21185, partial [Kofleriaceae bacterium]
DKHDLSATPPFSAHQEREVDVFATEFLMPEAWVAPYCIGTAPTLDAVHAIARTFRASIVASAVRYVELTPIPCAVVYSENGRVVWAKRSASFPGRIPAQLKIGAGAVALDHHESKPMPARARVVPASAWFGSHPAFLADPSLVEQAEVVPEPGWGGVLSLLAIV